MENYFNPVIDAGTAKLKGEGFESRSWAAPFPFQVSTFVKEGNGKNKEFAILIWSRRGNETDKNSEEFGIDGLKEHLIQTAPATKGLEEFGVPDGLEVNEPLFVWINAGDRVKKENFQSLYEYVHGTPNPDKLPSAEKTPLSQRLREMFSNAALPLVFGNIMGGEVAGPYRNHFNVVVAGGKVVRCSRYYIPGMKLREEDTEGVAWAVEAGQRKQKLIGLVSPFKAADGSQRLIIGYTYRTDPPEPR